MVHRAVPSNFAILGTLALQGPWNFSALVPARFLASLALFFDLFSFHFYRSTIPSGM